MTEEYSFVDALCAGPEVDNLPPQHYLSAEIATFLKDYYMNDLIVIAQLYPEVRAMQIDYSDLVHIVGFDCSRMLIDNPDKLMYGFEDAIAELCLPTYGADGEEIPPMISSEDKFADLRFRFVNLPVSARVPLRTIGTKHLNKFVTVEGMVRKITTRLPLAVTVAYKCMRRGCGQVELVNTKFGSNTHPPSECSRCEKTVKWTIVPEMCVFEDVQRGKVQESPEGLRGGEMPADVKFDIRADLTNDECQLVPGMRVVMNGVLRPRPPKNETVAIFDTILEVNSFEILDQSFDEITITPEDEVEIKELADDPMVYDKLIHSVAPTIYGYHAIKEAMALLLFGGVRKEMSNNALRGDSHMLLVGDPGTAKSQMINYLIGLSPRGVFTSGKSSTGAGLTCTAVKDELTEGSNSWTLEAGALVLADGGVCGVDEMDKMDRDIRSSLHEAMEQQRISVAKAGIVTSLRCQCSLIGAANPKLSRFDPYSPIAEQINLEPSLLSRFDLIFIVLDEVNADKDAQIANHILTMHRSGGLLMRSRHGQIVDEDVLAAAEEAAEPAIPIDLIRKFIAYSKRTCFPVLSEEAHARFLEFYTSMRSLGQGTNKPIPVTARSLEALVRLGEASARVRLSDTVTVDDADRVLSIVKESLRQTLFDSSTGQFDAGRRDGLSKSTVDKARYITDIIKEHTPESGVMRLDSIVEILGEKGISEDVAHKEITGMLRQGLLMSPRNGLIRVV